MVKPKHRKIKCIQFAGQHPSAGTSLLVGEVIIPVFICNFSAGTKTDIHFMSANLHLQKGSWPLA